MSSQTVIVKKDLGIHLRTAAEIMRAAKRYKSTVFLHCDEDCSKCRQADACSVIQLLSLEASQGKSVTITANGPDEHKAIKEIHRILTDRDQGLGVGGRM